MTAIRLEIPFSESAKLHGRDGVKLVKYPQERAFVERQLEPILAKAQREAILLTNEELVHWITAEIQIHLGVDFVFVGALSGSDWDAVTTLSVATDEGLAENFSYSLAGTPCGDVITQDSCVFPGEVASLYPEDELLIQMGIDSYVGIPLHDDVGRPIGLAVCLAKKPLAEETVIACLDLFSVFRPKFREILQARRTRHDLRMVGSYQTGPSDESWIVNLTRSLARVFSTTGSFIASADGILSLARPRTASNAAQGCLDADNPHLDQPERMIGKGDLYVDGAIINGELVPPSDITISEPLLANLRQGKRGAFITSGAVSWRGQGNDNLQSHDCLVIPIYDENERLQGITGVIHDRTLNATILDHPVTATFRERISYELRAAHQEVQRIVNQRRVLELERAESLGLLAGGIAHDFNNLLVGILGNADLLLMDMAESPNKAAADSLKDIRDAAISGSQLAKQLLTYAGRSQIEPKRFDLQKEVTEISRVALSSVASRAMLEMSASQEPLWVDGDPIQVRQIVMNLVTNAAQAITSKANGHIRLHTDSISGADANQTKCTIGILDPNQRYACLKIADNGEGMPAENVPRIFEPFYTTKSNGHGLGLASVHGIIRTHAGAALVESQQGTGTTITIYLPLADATDPATETDTCEPHANADERYILVIDDDPNVRRLVERFLMRMGHKVMLSSDGPSGLSLFREHRETIDAVLLDLAMPHMGGDEVLTMLREIDPEVKVLVSSGNMDEELKVPSLDKPYTFEDFDSAFAELLPKQD